MLGDVRTHACGCNDKHDVKQQDLHIPSGKILFEESMASSESSEGLLLLEERKILTSGDGEWGQKDKAGEG